jgi:predicted glycosyltransferase
MRVLIDIGHPAHVHFFRNPILLLKQRGHEVLITSREKEIAVDLLDELHIPHEVISTQAGGGIFALAKELVTRNASLYRVVKRFKPDIMAAIGGTFIAQVGKISGVQSLVFYDTENATLQNAITYPFASCVIVPRCYSSWLPQRRHLRYDGYHELSYLHPDYFTPNRERAISNGLAPEGDTFLIRVVSWQASHDIGEQGWNQELLQLTIDKLATQGKVLISSESELDSTLLPYQYPGNVSEIHHVMAFCRAFIGESATMASESVVLGVPAIYAATTGRGYTDEQETKYGMVKNIRKLDWASISQAIDEVLHMPTAHWQQTRDNLLANTIDVPEFVANCIEYPPPGQSQDRSGG